MPCLSGQGYQSGEQTRAQAQQQAAMLIGAQAALEAAWNAQALIANYGKQKAIADRANKIKSEYQDFLVNNFWPKEIAHMNEFSVKDAELFTGNYVENLGRRNAGRMIPMVAQKFAQEIKAAKCNFSRYCTSANKKTLQDLLLARSNAIASTRVAGRQMAFKEWRARVDQNYKRRLSSSMVGDGLLGQAASLYESAAGIYRQQGAALEAQFNSSLGRLGGAVASYSSAGARMDSIKGMSIDKDVVYGPSSFGVQNTWSQMTGASSNTFNAPFDMSAGSDGLGSYRKLSTVYSSNGDAVLQGSQLINQRDLARSGSYTYMVEGYVVTVNQGDFALHDYAEYDHGDQPQ